MQEISEDFRAVFDRMVNALLEKRAASSVEDAKLMVAQSLWSRIEELEADAASWQSASEEIAAALNRVRDKSRVYFGALTDIVNCDEVDMALDPTWAKRQAVDAIDRASRP
jgi:hypothetical protein